MTGEKLSMPARPRVLFLDAYDSFSNNITAMLTSLLDVDVFVLPIDSPLLHSPDLIYKELSHYTAVVCGPGPGSPTNQDDVGLMNCIWDLPDSEMLPVLGVCLGFQSLVSHSGGSIRRLTRGLHGMVREIVHVQHDIFATVGQFKATLYHSLGADIGQDMIPSECWEVARWQPTAQCPDVIPLAWVQEERDDGRVERILAAARHMYRPFWGVQYHPESVCTEPEGNSVVLNWFAAAVAWNLKRGRAPVSGDEQGLLARKATRPSLLSCLPNTKYGPQVMSDAPQWWRSIGVDAEFEFAKVEIPGHVQVPDIVEILGSTDVEQIVLDSANAHLPAPSNSAADVKGRFSIVALDVGESVRIEHHTGDDFATARLPSLAHVPVDIEERISLSEYGGLWGLLSAFQYQRRVGPAKDIDTPFLGGFMGYITYEQGLSGIGIALPQNRGHNRPDVCLAWITKSIVVDHRQGVLYVQHLRSRSEKGDSWVETTAATLRSSHLWQHTICRDSTPAEKMLVAGEKRSSSFTQKVGVAMPRSNQYENKVKLCQDFIAAGDSYELCLTDQTTITRRRSDCGSSTNHTTPSANGHRRRSSISQADSWQLFKILRARQPAPFASYLRLGPATLASASPERFLRYDSGGLCSMRPMKGTVRKSESVATLAQAERILHVPKEEAENLMIVDLVRHDLHGICGAGNVSVPQLLKVEEYQSVFQMITAVEGRLPQHNSGNNQTNSEMYTGLDVLAASLPPGSMTGAPKKRSCELLREIEEYRERSLYSGVVGYMCASGNGDWSVTIRSMFRWDDELATHGGEPTEVWRIGAGGAVTILSTAEGEREEMLTKLAGPLGVFADLV
jgi:para-aminobenzoate synthetase